MTDYLIYSSILVGRKPTSITHMYFDTLDDVLSYFVILKELGYKYDSLFKSFVLSRGRLYSIVTVPYEISALL